MRRWVIVGALVIGVLILAGLALLVGAGGREGDVGGALAGPVGGPGAGAVGYTPVPTATPWPTFTPVPVLVLPPTATPWPTLTPAPTVDSAARQAAIALLNVGKDGPEGAGGDSSEDPLVEVTLDGGGSALPPVIKQTFFPMQSVVVPDFLSANKLENLPEPVGFVRFGVPFVMWGVWFDTLDVPEDFEMEGTVRWVNVRGAFGDLVMRQSSVTVTRDEPFFYSGLGDAEGRVWKPGAYRVEFLDSEGHKSVSWPFEVR